MTEERKLKKGEPHPAALNALEFIKSMSYSTRARLLNTLDVGVSQKDRLSQVCAQTLENLDEGLPASDTEILGLAFTIINTEA